MSSVREQIVAAAVTALNTGRPGAVPVFVRSQTDSVTGTSLPAATVFPFKEEVRPQGGAHGPLVRRRLLLAVKIAAKGAPGSTAPDTALDATYAWAVKTLSDKTFNVLATDVAEVSTEFNYEQLDYPYCEAVTLFAVDYSTSATDAELTA